MVGVAVVVEPGTVVVVVDEVVVAVVDDSAAVVAAGSVVVDDVVDDGSVLGASAASSGAMVDVQPAQRRHPPSSGTMDRALTATRRYLRPRPKGRRPGQDGLVHGAEDRLEVTLLGTGSPLPHPERAGPSTLVQAGPVRLMIDCGRGSLMRLAGAGMFPTSLTALLLTHLHSDHVCDFNDLVTTRWVMSPGESPLIVVGPPGTRRFVDATLAMLADDIGWRIAHHDDLTSPPSCQVTEIVDGEVDAQLGWSGTGLRVLVAPTSHRPVHPTIGFRLEYGGAAVAVVGDSLPCDGVDRLTAGASIYVQTVVREVDVRAIPSTRLQDILEYHSTTTQAAATAARAGVGTLVMTHMVPAPDAASGQFWIDDARAEFTGHVVVGADLDSFVATPRPRAGGT